MNISDEIFFLKIKIDELKRKRLIADTSGSLAIGDSICDEIFELETKLNNLYEKVQ